MIRERFITWLFEQTHEPYAERFKQHREPWGLSNADLMAMPDDRFGHLLGHYMHTRGLTFMPRLESHDVLHVLTGVGTDVHEEIALQWLLVGNGKRSLYSAVVVLLGSVVFPEQLPLFWSWFQRGAALPEVHRLPFRELLDRPAREVMAITDSDDDGGRNSVSSIADLRTGRSPSTVPP